MTTFIAVILLAFLVMVWVGAIELGRRPAKRKPDAAEPISHPRMARPGVVRQHDCSAVPHICRRCGLPIRGPARVYNDEWGTTYECFKPCESPVLASEAGESLPVLRSIEELMKG